MSWKTRMGIRSVVKKEFKEFKRDKGFILTLIIEPLILMLVFGYTFQADITYLDTIIIDADNSEYSQEIINAIEDSEYFNNIRFSGTLEKAKRLLEKSEVRAVFFVPDDFQGKLKNATKAQVYLYLDSSDYTIYNLLKGASGEVIKDTLKDIVVLIVDDLESERDAKQREIDQIQELVDGLDEKASSTLDDIDDILIEFRETRNLIADTESKIWKAQADINEIEADVSGLESDIGEALDDLSEFYHELDKAEEQVDELAYWLETVISSNPGLSTYLGPLESELEDLEQILRSSKADVSEMEIQIGQTLAKIEGLRPSQIISISAENYNIPAFYQKVNVNEQSAYDINRTANEIEDTYRSIQSRMDAIRLELRTLKKEFLSSPLEIEKEYLFGEISYFKYLTPAIMTLILFFIGVVLTTVNIVDERKSRTLFRVATTPLKKIEFLGGKFLLFLMVGFIESIYVLFIALFLFNVQIAGSLLDVIFVLLLLIAASIGLGLLISSLVKSMRQAVMLVPLVIIPSVLISQTFSPIEVMPAFMQKVAYLSPMFYSNVALREIMIKGSSISAVAEPVLILAFYALITLLLGVFVSKKRIE
jgi:ABC-type multidrug transport system permease subunit/predicted  nucleic acid-binding Zn-ribbon protein